MAPATSEVYCQRKNINQAHMNLIIKTLAAAALALAPLAATA